MKVLEKGIMGDFASDVEVGSGTLWLPYKSIWATVNKAVEENSSESFTDLDACGKKYKGDFSNFLNYRGKSTSDREIIKKAVSDGITLRGQETKQMLHPQLVNETLLLSDIFEINEFLSLDLLAIAEGLKEEYPGWARGLIAVYLYYEGRLCMIQTMCTMLTSVSGRTWYSESIYPRVTSMFKTLLGYAFKNDIVDSLLGHLSKCNIKSQLEVLENNLALGDWRHRCEINRLINGIRDGLAFLVFAHCAQQDVSWKETLRILEYIKAKKFEPGSRLEKPDFLLISAVILSFMNHLGVGDYDKAFAKEALKYLKEQDSKKLQDGGFQSAELLELFRFTFQVATHKTASELTTNTFATSGNVTADIVKDDEDTYFRTNLFAFLRDEVFCDPAVFAFEEIIVQKYHQLFTDFLTSMSFRVKEMKSRSDDAAKTAALYQNQGFVRPPNLPQDYESFMECLGLFYSNIKQTNAADFFNPDTKFLALNKLVRSACLDPPAFFVSNAKFLAGLGKGAPEQVFEIMKRNGHNFSFEHFFDSILAYMSSFGSKGKIASSAFTGGFGMNLFASETYQKVVHDAVRLQMNPAEIDGLCSYLEVVQVLCESSSKISSYFTSQKQGWIQILLESAKVRSIPRDIRARMIRTAAVMISEHCSHEAVTGVWNIFYDVKLIGQESGDFKDELEEHEARAEEYPLTISMLRLLNALVSARFKKIENDANIELDGFIGNLDNGAFDGYVAYVRDSVLLRALYRTYRKPRERWEVLALSIDFLSRLLDYVPQLMFQLLCGSPLLRSVLSALKDCVQIREILYENQEPVNRCAYASLDLLRRALHRQSYFLHKKELSAIRHEAVIVGLQELLMRINPENGKPEFVLCVLKYLDPLNPMRHRQAAFDILWLTLADRDDVDAHLYASIISDPNLVALLRYTFINTISEGPEFDEMRKSVLHIIRVSVVHSTPNVAMMLLGVDKKVDFQNAGVAGYPRTVLHAILENAANLPDAFQTLLTLIKDPRLWNPLLRYLKTNHFLSNFVRDYFPSPAMEMQDIGFLLKCIAVELKTTMTPGPLAKTIIGDGSSKFQEILTFLELDEESLEMPELEFFDQENVLQAMKSCEYFDPNLKIKVIRTDMLDNLLKEEIAKLEKNTVIKLRHTVHGEAKEIVEFATVFNNNRWKEACKSIMFDGWRQCLEVLVLSTETLKLAGVDFVTGILRVLLHKVIAASSPRDYFCRLASETCLTLCAVMATFKHQVNATTISVILNHICKWISEEQSPRVRATLYSAMLHVVRMYKNPNEVGGTTMACFSLVLEHVSKDCCQTKEIGKMQAMYLMGELVRLTADKGFLNGGGDGDYDPTAITFHSSVAITASKTGLGMDTADISFNARSVTPQSGRQLRSQASSKQGGYVPTDRPYAHASVLAYVSSKGFISSLVDTILTLDDGDIAKLFSSQPLHMNMKSLYVFEAKMSLLCRYALTGKRAITNLVDANAIPKLSDMRVLQIQYFQEDNVPSQLAAIGSTLNTTGGMTSPTRKGVTTTLFSTVLKLLHCMIDATPKNILLVEQIWHFLGVHDLSLGQLITRSVIEEDEPNVACNLLLGLLAKVMKLLPASAFVGRNNMMARVEDVLKVHAVRSTYSDFRIQTLRQVMLIIHSFSHNVAAMRELRKIGVQRKFRPIVNKNLEHDLLLENPEKELTIGVIVRIVSDVAGTILNWSNGGAVPKKKLEAVTSILEIGMDFIHQHVEYFLTEKEYKSTAKQFKESFSPLVENRLVRFVGDAAKIIENGQFIEMLLLRIRRMIMAPN